MGLFTNILDKLGIKEKADKKPVASKPVVIPKTAAKTTTTAKPTTVADKKEVAPGLKKFMVDRPAGSVTVPKSAAVTVVDVVAKLEKLAAENPEKLDWKVSIVDLLKLLGIDHSLAARKELAVELGCPVEKMEDSAAMNTWLHKTVLQKIAENGGNIPAHMLD